MAGGGVEVFEGDFLASAQAALMGAIMTNLFHFRGFDIPVDLIQKTGAGPEAFEPIARARRSRARTVFANEDKPVFMRPAEKITGSRHQGEST